MSATHSNKSSTPLWMEVLGWIVLILLTVGALWLRFEELGLKPMHHDEGVNAWFTKRLVEEFYYRYNPYYYHGPFLYFITAPFLAIFGYTAEAMRMAPALLGALVVPAFYLFKDRVGWLGVIVMAAFMAVAPVEVYFSRTAIHEIYNGVFNVTLVAGLYVYWSRKSPWALYLAAASLALLFATKETTAITVLAVVPAALITAAIAFPRTGLPGNIPLPHRVITLGPRWWRRAENGQDNDLERWPGLEAPRSVLLSSSALNSHIEEVREAARAVITAQSEAEAVARARMVSGPPKSPKTARYLGRGSIAASRIPFFSFSLEYLRGLRRGDPRSVKIAIGVFVVVMVALFTSFLTDPSGVGKFFAAFFGWGNTGVQGKGHEKVWYYFIEKLLWAYYRPILVLGMVGLVLGTLKRDAFSIFNLVWFILALAAYSVIPYKTPWCSISFATPLFFGMGIAVKGLVDLAKKVPVAPLRPLVAAIPLIAGLYPLATYAQESYDIQFKDYDVDGLHFAYVQNIREFMDLVDDLNGIIEAAELEGQTPDMFMIRAKNPLRWYIANYPDDHLKWTREYKKPREKDMKAADIVIAQRSQSKELKKLLGKTDYEYRWYHERPGQKFDVYIKKSLWTLYEKAAKEGKVAAITQNPPPARSYSDIKTAEWRKAKRDAERDSMGLIPQKPKAAYPNPKPVKKETVQGSKVKNGKKRDGKSETLRKRLKRIKKEKGELGKKERK